jgi:uncharacterized protein YciI
MALYVLTCLDKPGALQVRMGARERHLEWVRAASNVKLAGPFLDEQGDMAGSLFILEAEDAEAVRRFNAEDPYTQAGLWASVDVRGFRVGIGSL